MDPIPVAPIRLNHLPDEVIQLILEYLQPREAVALGSTSHRFQEVANEPLVWKSYCHRYITYWHPGHNISAKLNGTEFTKWKELFVDRARKHSTAKRALQDIINEPLHRIKKLESIAALGYDAKQALLEQSRPSPTSRNFLAQRYWTHVALGNIHRSMAINEWIALKHEDGHDTSFERALGAFDLFVLQARDKGDIDDIINRLDHYAACVRRAHNNIDNLSARSKAHLVAHYLGDRGWIGIRPSREYHNIEHNFLGVALYGPGKNSLPLISVVIYCYVLRQFGVLAAPCSFPFHVHAVLRPLPGFDLDGMPLLEDAEPQMMYMDPWRSDTEVPISSLRQQLRFMSHQAPSSLQSGFLTEATARDITIRCARNILNSPSQSSQAPLEDIEIADAIYAAYWALVLLPTDAFDLRQITMMLMHAFDERYPYDVALIESHILPLMQHTADYPTYLRACRTIRAADAVRKTPKPRTGPNATVMFKVGQVFRHRRYAYTAVITAWDPKCSLGEAWIQQNGVDRLPKGRDQGFYHALEQTGTMRYVAQENIELFWPSQEEIDAFPIEVGKYFKCWNPENRIFESNIRDEYPDD